MTDQGPSGLPAVPASVLEATRFSRACHEFVWSQIDRTNFVSDPKNNLVLAYGAVALEHHSAIIVLCEAGLCGSAFALLRPQIETVFRCLWVINLASEEQLDAIGQRGSEPFPRFRDLAAVLDESYQAEDYFRTIATRWSMFNGYTHSGLEQLGRRFRDDGNVAPNYPEGEVAAFLRFSASLSLALFNPIFKMSGFPEKAAAITEWAASNNLP